MHHGSIIPGKRDEMWRDIFLDRGAKITGGLFGNSLTVLNPGVEVEKSVYVRNPIKISLKARNKEEMVIFGSNVVSPDSMIVEGGGARARFSSDVYVNKANLENSIIYGNIYCSSAIIKNSIVLGGVYCKNRLAVENSILYTFDAGQLEPGENLSLLSPFGFSRSPFDLDHPVRALTFFNLREGSNELSYPVTLDEDDVFELSVSSDDNQSGEKRYLISIIERVLNTTEIIESFRKNKEIIEFFAMGSHLDKEYMKQFREFQKEDIEARLWKVIDQHIETPQEENGKDIKEVIERLFEY